MKENKIVNICCKIAKPDHRLMIHVSEAFYQLLYEESDLFPQRTIIKIGNKRLFDPLVPRSALRKWSFTEVVYTNSSKFTIATIVSILRHNLFIFQSTFYSLSFNCDWEITLLTWGHGFKFPFKFSTDSTLEDFISYLGKILFNVYPHEKLTGGSIFLCLSPYAR